MTITDKWMLMLILRQEEAGLRGDIAKVIKALKAPKNKDKDKHNAIAGVLATRGVAYYNELDLNYLLLPNGDVHVETRNIQYAIWGAKYSGSTGCPMIAEESHLFGWLKLNFRPQGIP